MVDVMVPFPGAAPAITSTIAGHTPVAFTALPPAISAAKEGKVRALAVMAEKRVPALPDVPTMAEFVPGYEASSFHGIAAPKGAASEIIDKLNKEINAALADPKLKARLADLGGTVLTGTPADFGRFMAEEIEKWGKVVKFSGAKQD